MARTNLLRPKSSHFAWTQEEDEFILASEKRMTRTSIARALGRSTAAVITRLSRLREEEKSKALPVPTCPPEDKDLLLDLVRMAYAEGHEITIPTLGATFKRPPTVDSIDSRNWDHKKYDIAMATTDSFFEDDDAAQLINPATREQYVHFTRFEEIDSEDNYKAWGGRGDCKKVHFNDEGGGNFAICFGFHKGFMAMWVEVYTDWRQVFGNTDEDED